MAVDKNDIRLQVSAKRMKLDLMDGAKLLPPPPKLTDTSPNKNLCT